MTGQELRNIRERHQLTQEGLARELNLSVYTIQSNESREKVTRLVKMLVEQWQKTPA